MDWGVRLPLILLLLFPAVKAQWGDPALIDPENKDVTFEVQIEGSSYVYWIRMNEDLEPPIVIAKLNFKDCDDCSEPVITNFETGSNQFLEAATEKKDDAWVLVVNAKVNYDILSSPRFSFVISNQHNVILDIINIDNNPPSVIPITVPCEIEENYNGPTECFYDISDNDGWLQYMVWEVNGTRGEASMFDFAYVDDAIITNFTQLATTEMVLKDNVTLDYETYSAHLITWTITDSGHNQAVATIIVNVIDLPDTPPRWTQIFSVEQFEEKSRQEFVVNAIDGDIAINDNIFYTMISDYGDLFTIDNLTGKITVEGINRDALQQEIFLFTLRATEEHEPNFYVEQDVTFIVSDINDNAPTIMQPETKVLNLEFPEARITDIEDVIIINDIDSSANAMYTVTLIDSTVNLYNSPFQVIPSQGYQEYSFSLSIINSTLLDYEDEDWRSFTFKMFVQETVDPNHTDELIINVQLTNWNDESPVFTEENYEASINETIGIDEHIIQVLADDRDVGDRVEYELVGSSANRILNIDKDSGVITTSVSNAFDYERQTEMIVQVLARDTLVDEYGTRHTTYAQLTILVLDINDETPRITVGSTASIFENQDDGAEIPVQITAIDEDTTADLLFYINWNQSYATKSGRIFYFTSTELSSYKESVKVATENVDDSSGYVKAVMTISETVEDNTPDYEVFDTLYLSLTVEDLNQEVNLGTDTVTVTVFIEDVNDNAPVFTEDSITANNTVMEASGTGSTVGTIVATDADGPDYNTVTYYLTETDDTPEGLITIDATSGMLTVASDQISADTPEERWYLYYNVTASDGELQTSANIKIFIIDINNNDPVFDEFEEIYEVEEKSPNGTPVAQLIATDRDRDEPYNVVWYAFTSTASNDAREVFTMDADSGALEVTDRNGVILDRDEGIAEFTVSFRAGDNRYGSYQRYSEEQTLKIVLLDINDQYPIIETTALEISESLEKGAKIDIPIIATDKDDPNTNNTDIQFTLKGLQDSDGNEVEQLFEIASQELTGVAYLSTIKDLKNNFGEYKLIIETNDLGINPETGTHNYYTNEISVTITKYNFEDPVFTYPTAELRVFLSKTQDLNRQLYLYNYDPLPLIAADDQQGGKWDIQFSIDEEQSQGGSIFTIINSEGLGQSKGMLQLVTYPEDWEGLYTLHIVANDYGEPAKTASVNLHVRFYDPESLPYFPDGQRLLQTNFTENSTGLLELREFQAASYNYGEDEQEWEFEIYYLLLEGDGDLFAVNSSSRTITLKEMLDREEVDYYQLKIIASNSESVPSSYDERSVLVVDIEVIDVNDNPPHFYRSYYSNGISTTTSLQSTIVTLSAYDLDKDETLTFTIVEDSLQTVGTGISELSAPFELDLYSGVITLNFRVQANMDGYFVFTVQVADSPPENHTDTATVQVFIITESNRVDLTFENPLDAVINLQDTVQEILEDFFLYTCNIESILSATDQNGQTVDTQTVVTAHFVDPEESVPINKTEIQSKLSDIEFFTSLRATFINNTLYLLSYTSSSTAADNMEEQLRAWLIGVSVTLGSLCIVILIAFILKTRSLKRRLDNLSTVKPGSMDSGINRIGIALPNTNKNALECSNPLYNEEKKMPDIDQSSIHSGDSDLIGVEDNPEFDYVPNTKL